MITITKIKKIVIYSILLALIVVSVSRWRVVSVSDGHIINSNEVIKIEKCQNILLLGAKIKFDGSMSPILKERAMAVEELYKKGKVCKIIVSGYKEVGDDYVYDEVSPVVKYLIAQGIPEEMIVSDFQGIDTFTSLKNVREIFKLVNIVIVTQKFHLPRAVYIGRELGLNTIGFEAFKFPYPTKSGMYKDFLREWPASVKAVWQVEIINYVTILRGIVMNMYL